MTEENVLSEYSMEPASASKVYLAPNADQLHFDSAIYRLRRNGTHIEWYNGGAWIQLD